jgi:hypothetical protein
MRSSWCQGMAGIGLARLEVSALVGSGLRSGLDALLHDVAPTETGPSPSDQMCCGNMGSDRVPVASRRSARRTTLARCGPCWRGKGDLNSNQVGQLKLVIIDEAIDALARKLSESAPIRDVQPVGDL